MAKQCPPQKKALNIHSEVKVDHLKRHILFAFQTDKQCDQMAGLVFVIWLLTTTQIL